MGGARPFALYRHRNAARRREGCVLSSAKIKVFFRISMILLKENGLKNEMEEMREKSCGLSFDSPLLLRKNSLLFWRKSRVCFSLVTPGVFPRACRCAGADTRSRIAHSVSLKFLPSPFTFTTNGLICSWLCVKVECFFSPSPVKGSVGWSLHPQSLVHQLIILYGWRGEGKKRKTPDARVYACEIVKEVVLLKSLLGGFFKRVASDHRYVLRVYRRKSTVDPD